MGERKARIIIMDNKARLLKSLFRQKAEKRGISSTSSTVSCFASFFFHFFYRSPPERKMFWVPECPT